MKRSAFGRAALAALALAIAAGCGARQHGEAHVLRIADNADPAR